MQSKQLLRSLISGAMVASVALVGATARAEVDTFGLGDGHNGAKTVAGNETVNSYAPVAADVAPGATQIAFGAVRGDAAGFAAGDLVMVWRAVGVATSEVGSRFTDRLQLTSAGVGEGAVGTYELARVQIVTGSTMTLTKPLVRGFKKDVSQVVKVPEYTTLDVPINTSIVATPWEASGTGFSGGIVVVLANGAITLGGKIDADGAGFRGGAKVQRLANLTAPCTAEDGTPADGFANKGEGVLHTEFGPTKGGRGNWSLAAGGGNCQESGGGGGGNFGAGGVGGDSILSSGRGGRGGVGIDYSLLERITLGGGGGAGEQKNGVGSDGGRGGGAIILRAKSVTGTGTFSAIGATAANAGILNLESDGAGGGGAGGSILVRTTGQAECGGLTASGGNGGDTQVVGVGAWGPGGGGGGGRVLIQALGVGADCKANVAPGANGSSGVTPRGATAGVAGATQPAPTGPYCFSNPPVAADSQCADPKPVCDIPNGECKPCNGGFGSGSTLSCPVPNEPVCSTDGSCAACERDFTVPGNAACQTLGAPYCELTGPDAGKCGKCENDADCVGPTHAGPKCHLPAGFCGTACTSDTDCKNTEWCSQNVCIPKTPNGQPVSNFPPDTNGQCTPPVGARTCLSGVCEEDDDLCGLKNGSPCDETKKEQCRSNICHPPDDLCGLPNGAPCQQNEQCRSLECKAGVCAGCQEDTDCVLGQVCDKATNQCVPGCRPGAQAPADGGRVHGQCPPGEECKARDGGMIGDCVPIADAGADAGPVDAGDTYAAGLVEGGGCSCRTSVAAATPPFAFFAAAAAGMFAVRRRRNHRDRDCDSKSSS